MIPPLVVLAVWPLLVMVLFRIFDLPRALILSVVLGHLLLPTGAGWNLPMLPQIDKFLIPSLSAAVMCLLLAHRDRLEAAQSASVPEPAQDQPAQGRPEQGRPGVPAMALARRPRTAPPPADAPPHANTPARPPDPAPAEAVAPAATLNARVTPAASSTARPARGQDTDTPAGRPERSVAAALPAAGPALQVSTPAPGRAPRTGGPAVAATAPPGAGTLHAAAARIPSGGTGSGAGGAADGGSRGWAGGGAFGPNPVRWLLGGLLVLALLSPFVTALTNTDQLVYGPRVVTGLSPYDGLSMLSSVLVTLLPFLLAMRFLGSPERLRIVLQLLVVTALGYSLLALYEVRMAPVLHVKVYGYFPHSFAQHLRAGGWRPVVFFNHGLVLGMFFAMATLAACALWRDSLRRQVSATPVIAAALWLAVTLTLTRTLGAFWLVLLFAPLILFASVRIQVLTAGVVAAMVLTYPVLRTAGLVPLDQILSLATRVDVDRAQSFQFRIDNEDRLLDHATNRQLAGWGSWGRNRVYDPVTGFDLTVTDGLWVIVLTGHGWLGYIGQFGLLTLPLVLIAFRRREALDHVGAGLALVLAALLIDQVPNATLTPIGWLVAGALTGRLLQSEGRAEARAQAAAPAPPGPTPRGVRGGGSTGAPPGPAAPVPVALRGPTPAPVNGLGGGLAGATSQDGSVTAPAQPHRRRPRG